ncbi:hypothetical protein [Streptomyces sp. NPDC020141]|uniref:hypothetical protein n=1 Tax=Streptomyces sp. NPDC020141 TaxID=3365065 RepID=UPI0037B864FD
MTNPRSAVRLRLAALAVAPVLALSVACGGDGGAGAKPDDAIAEAPKTSSPAKGESDGKGEGKDEGKGGGGASAAPGGKSAFYDAQMEYVRCMRAKGGYPDFPDPRLSGHLDWDKINEIGAQPGRNEGIKGGKNGACRDEIQTAMAATPKIDQQKAYESMLAHAQCMRDNGVSRFTNPTMSGGNVIPGGDPSPASPVLDPRSPSYKKADKACESKLLEGLDGMQ